jgi:TrmH family RNA methyltransferase
MLSWCRAGNIRTVCADVATGMPYTDIDWKRSTALIIGPEATGLSPEELAAAGTAIRIPMHGKVESLNAGVAAGIMLYEAARQRHGLTHDV